MWLSAGVATFGLFAGSIGCIRSISTIPSPSPTSTMSSSTFSLSLRNEPTDSAPSRPTHSLRSAALSGPPIAICCTPRTRNGRPLMTYVLSPSRPEGRHGGTSRAVPTGDDFRAGTVGDLARRIGVRRSDAARARIREALSLRLEVVDERRAAFVLVAGLELEPVDDPQHALPQRVRRGRV